MFIENATKNMENSSVVRSQLSVAGGGEETFGRGLGGVGDPRRTAERGWHRGGDLAVVGTAATLFLAAQD